jgi:hypothetical protein
MALGLSRALAAAQAGEEYRRPDHPRCSWPAYAEDEGLTDWQADLLYEGYSACGTPCDTKEVGASCWQLQASHDHEGSIMAVYPTVKQGSSDCTIV